MLLDTHAFIWFAADTSQLSSTAFAALKDAANQLYLSDASIWEMAIKVQLKKLKYTEPFDHEVIKTMSRAQVSILPIATRHITAVSNLPLHHRDPFDRLLAVQARIENYTLVTHDPLFVPYGVNILW